MLDISTYKTKSREAAFYPYILDRNPKIAANFLTIKDSLEVYSSMKKVYDDLKDNKSSYPIIQDSMLSSRDNFLWFSYFFRELERLIMGENLYSIPYDKLPKNREGISFYPPFSRFAKNGKCHLKLRKFRVKNLDPINLYRVFYIKKGYVLEDFREGYPAWYLLEQTTIYECYNEKTNVRIRIDFLDGEFYYFVSGASDNWQQIMDVPLEMDSVVSALLFRSLCQEGC